MSYDLHEGQLVTPKFRLCFPYPSSSTVGKMFEFFLFVCFGFFSTGLSLESKASSMLSRNQPLNYTPATEVFNAPPCVPLEVPLPSREVPLPSVIPALKGSLSSMLPTLTSTLWPWKYYSLFSLLKALQGCVWLPWNLLSYPMLFKRHFYIFYLECIQIRRLIKTTSIARNPVPLPWYLPLLRLSAKPNHSLLHLTFKEERLLLHNKKASWARESTSQSTALLLEGSITPGQPLDLPPCKHGWPHLLTRNVGSV